MQMSLSTDDLASYVARQLAAFFPDASDVAGTLARPVERAVERAERCFSRINLKYFNDDGTTRFDHLHTDQYAVFLYLLSNTIFRADGDPRIAAKVYALNKALHGVEGENATAESWRSRSLTSARP